MTNDVKEILLEGLKLKEASIKRAINTATNPKFKPIYDLELETTFAARKWINEQKIS